MVVDTSALIAILLLEPEAERCARTIAGARTRLLSAASRFEAGIVIEGRLGLEAGGDLDDFVADVGLEIEPVTADQVRVARRPIEPTAEAIIQPSLSFGDCFASALLKITSFRSVATNSPQSTLCR